MGEKCFNKITKPKHVRLLFLSCWIVYFSTYLGRLNYSAVLNEMIQTEGFSKGMAGLIGTGFFLTYGFGQLISGFAGDYLSPAKLIFTGVFLSGTMNLLMFCLTSPKLMMIIWCMNGLAQALIWSPMLRLLFEYLTITELKRACIQINSSVPFGTVAAYGICALILWANGNWRHCFLFAALWLLLVAAFWLISLRKIENWATQEGEPVLQEAPSAERGRHKGTWLYSLYQSGLLFLLVALVVQGSLKDGVTTWVPTYISEIYGFDSIASIISTMLIPLCNLVGIYAADEINKRILHSEIKTATFFFSVCAVALGILFISSGKSFPAAFAMLAVSTTSMMGVNTMLIAVLPSYFGKIGKSSSISGILNSAVYVGCAFSTYGIGILSSTLGWTKTILCWVLMAVLAGMICRCIYRKWVRYYQIYLK